MGVYFEKQCGPSRIHTQYPSVPLLWRAAQERTPRPPAGWSEQSVKTIVSKGLSGNSRLKNGPVAGLFRQDAQQWNPTKRAPRSEGGAASMAMPTGGYHGGLPRLAWIFPVSGMSSKVALRRLKIRCGQQRSALLLRACVSGPQ